MDRIYCLKKPKNDHFTIEISKSVSFLPTFEKYPITNDSILLEKIR